MNQTVGNRYLLTCDCGHEFEVSPGSAGLRMTCDKCSGEVVVPSLSYLRRLPALSSPQLIERIQVSLAFLMGVMVAWAAAVRFWWMAAIFLVLGATFVAGWLGFKARHR